MKATGYSGFERGKHGSTAEHLTVLEYKSKMRQEELADKISKLELTTIELDEIFSDLENARIKINQLKTEQTELQSERDKLEKEVAPIRELKKLKTKTAEIEIPDKPPTFGNPKISYDDLVKLKKMADTYIANEDEIKDIRKRRVAVSKKEDAAAEKEKDLNDREKILVGKEDTLASAAKVKSERDELKNEVRNQSNELISFARHNVTLSEKLKGAYDAISNIVKAARLLKYASDKYGDYKIENLTPKQGTLLDALAAYGARLADENKYVDHAESIRKFIDLGEDVIKEMRILNPDIEPDPNKNLAQAAKKPPQKSRDAR